MSTGDVAPEPLPHVRAAGWLQEHPAAGNAILVTLLAPIPILITGTTGTGLISGLLLLVPLYLRATHPARAACLFAAIVLVSVLFLRVWPFAIGVWGAPWLMHTVAARCPRRVRRAVLALALLTCLVSALMWPHWWLSPGLYDDVYQPTYGEWTFGVITLLLLTSLVMIAAHLSGDLKRATLERQRAEQERAEALAERAHRLEIERDQEVRLAAQDERTRIAREMHDVVAHSLSVVIAQADGARYAVRSDPSVAADVLGTIAETARGSLGEMRSLLGVLRTDEEAERAPIPTVQDLPALVDSVRGAGLEVELEVHPAELPQLPSGPSLAVYRLVQEGLTNTLKHAPQATAARVHLGHDGSDLVVQVRSDGRLPGPDGGDTAPSSGGQGLRGLGERFRLYGGEIEAGPDPADPHRWVLSAWLPLDSTAAGPPLQHDTAARTTPTTQEDTR